MAGWHRRNNSMRRAAAVALWMALLTLTPLVVSAQIDTGGVSGVITDQTGAVLPGVTVTVTSLATNQVRSVTTDERGRYRFSGLTPGKYSLTAELQGFATLVRPEITVNIGSALDVNMTLKVSPVAETVTVRAEAPLVQSSKTDLSRVITSEQIETLPSKGRNYLDFTLLAPATVENSSTTYQGSGLNIGGARAKEAALLVDGFYNMDEGFALPRQRYSQEIIQEFQVVTLGATAEFGRAIGGIVNAITKSGANAFSGSAFGFFRNKSLNAQTVQEKQRGLPKSEFNRRQWGGTIGGPIVRDRTFFFGSMERLVENTPYDNNITPADAAAIGLPPADAGTVPSYRKLWFTMAKVDHSLNSNHRLQASFVRSDYVEHNVDFDTFVARSRPLNVPSVDTSYQFKWTGVASEGKWLHDLKAAYFPRDYSVIGLSEGGPPLMPDGQINRGYSSATSPPIVGITGVANFGTVSLNNHIRTYPVQVLYSSSVFADKHSIKFGADMMYAKFDYSLYSSLAGRYTFNDLASFLRGQYSTYTQTFGDPDNFRSHKYLSGFIQDSWAVSNRLTMNYGLRYDLELNPTYKDKYKFGNDYNNFGPRFALSYDLTGKGTTFAKLSSGLYYDRLFLNLTTFFYSLKQDPQQFSATWRYGQAGAPVYPQTFPELPSNAPQGIRNVWIMPDKTKVPTSGQVVATLEHAFNEDFAISTSLLYNRSWNKEMGWDRNLVFDDATQKWIRPEAQYRLIRQYRFIGRAEYVGAVFEVTKRAAQRKLLFSGNLTVARAKDTGNNYGTQPNDLRFPEKEWGRAADTPTVRVVANAAYQINKFMQVSGIFRARTGYWFDPRSGGGYDLNADGNFNDRTPGFERNSFRGPGNHSLDARFVWSIPHNDRRLQFFAEMFNVFNTDTVRSLYSTYGPTPGSPDPLFGKPLTYFPPREVQLGVRVAF